MKIAELPLGTEIRGHAETELEHHHKLMSQSNICMCELQTKGWDVPRKPAPRLHHVPLSFQFEEAVCPATLLELVLENNDDTLSVEWGATGESWRPQVIGCTRHVCRPSHLSLSGVLSNHLATLGSEEKAQRSRGIDSFSQRSRARILFQIDPTFNFKPFLGGKVVFRVIHFKIYMW